MTEKEKVFIEKFNEFLVAVKEMEAEGNIRTQIGIKLTSYENYKLTRMKLIHELNGKFLDNNFEI